MKNIAIVIVTVALVFALGWLPALAQEAAEEFKLDEMVVTGTRTEKLLLDVPIRTEVIDAEEIEAAGATTLYQALEGCPNIRVEQQCSACNFSMVRMLGLSPENTQVLINGLPIYSGLASIYGLDQIPASSIEKIEIVKGCGSALYGSNAIAGVINVITRRVPAEPRIEASAQIGEYATNVYTGAASMRLGEQADMVINAQKSQGNPIDWDGKETYDRVYFNDIAAGARINYYDLLGDDAVTLSGNTLTEDRKGGTPEDYENPFAEGSEHIDTQRYESVLSYSKEFAAENELAFAFAYANHNRDATNDTFVGDYMATHDDQYPPSNLLEPYIAKEDNYTADIQYSHPVELAGTHTLLAGVQYNHNKLDETGMYVRLSGVFEGSPYKSEDDKKADDYGIFIQDDWEILDNLELVYGARYDNHDSKDTFEGNQDVGLDPVENNYDEDQISPRVALSYKPVPEIILRGSVGRGFLVPYSFSEDLHLCSGSPRVYKSGNLKPEKSWSYMLSADYVGEWLLLSLGVFHVEVKDKIALADADEFARELGFDYEWKNEGKSHTQGLEAQAQFLVMDDLLLDVYGTYTDAKFNDERSDWAESHPEDGKESKYISRVPEWTTGASLTFSPGDWTFLWETNLTGQMYIDYYEEDDIENPGSEIVRSHPFALTNVRLAYAIDAIGAEVFAGARNLFNKVQSDRRYDDAAFIYAPLFGRVAYAGAKVVF